MLAGADGVVRDAEVVLEAGVLSVAGREAYIAMHRAAQALIFELMGKRPKTHNGVQALFAELARGEPGLGVAMAASLSRAYPLKQESDYGSRERVTLEESRRVLTEAREFVGAVRRFLAARKLA